MLVQISSRHYSWLREPEAQVLIKGMPEILDQTLMYFLVLLEGTFQQEESMKIKKKNHKRLVPLSSTDILRAVELIVIMMILALSL